MKGIAVERIDGLMVMENKLSDAVNQLRRAARSGHADVVLWLLKQRVDIDAKDENGWCSLLIAVEYGNTEVVDVLVAGGADVTVRDGYGNTALMIAARRHNLEMTRTLLDHDWIMGPTLTYTIIRGLLPCTWRRFGAAPSEQI